MDRKKLTYLVLGIVAFAALLVYFLNSSGSSSSKSADGKNPEPYYSSSKWSSVPKLGSKDPYGLYIFEQLLIASGKFSEFNDIYDYRLMDSILMNQDQLFMFVGHQFALTETESNELLNSVADGNELFVSANRFPSHFLNHLFNRSDLSFYAEDSVIISTEKDDYSMYFLYEKDTLGAIWKVFPSIPSNVTVHSRINDKPNYIAYPYGKGTVYLHANVLAFQNFQLLRKQGKEYMKEVIEPLSKSNIQWLAYADYVPYEREMDEFDGGGNTSLLARIFEYKSLRWAFFIISIGFILFFLFRSKREQPVIPIYKETTNAGMSYVDTIAGLYFAENSPNRIRKILLRNFYTAIQNHFFIDLSKRISDKTLQVLSEKSKVSYSNVERLVKDLESKEKLSKQGLFSLHQRLREFYLISGIWNLFTQPKLDKYISFYRPTGYGMGLIAYGIIAIVTAFILLANAKGYGVLFWPIGIFCVYLGARMLSKPMYQVNTASIVYIPLFGSIVDVHRNDIQEVTLEDEILRVHRYAEEPVTIYLSKVTQKQKENLLDLVYSFNRN
jgi:hypothetical protein